MKKFFENLYVFSKLTFSLLLLLCLIGVLYVFYTNYKKENIISLNQSIIEEELKININKNKDLINKISNELQFNKSTLSEIKKNIELISKKDQNEDLLIVNKNIQLLKENIDNLSKELQTLRNENNTSLIKKNENIPNSFDKRKNDIINLIMLKYENNSIILKEIEYLSKIIDDTNIPKVEKLSVLSTSPFKGYKYLNDLFKEEVSIYLKKTINKKSNSFFGKFLLPYIEVSPTTENNATNDLILKIKKVQSFIEKRNIDEASRTLATIESYEENFKYSIIEINRYLNFKTHLDQLR